MVDDRIRREGFQALWRRPRYLAIEGRLECGRQGLGLRDRRAAGARATDERPRPSVRGRRLPGQERKRLCIRGAGPLGRDAVPRDEMLRGDDDVAPAAEVIEVSLVRVLDQSGDALS